MIAAMMSGRERRIAVTLLEWAGASGQMQVFPWMVVDSRASARALADKLVKKAPQALGASKAVINACQNLDTASGRILERMAQTSLILSEDHKEGVKAFREKRPSQYKGR